MYVTRLVGSECLECQQCDFELNADSNREPTNTLHNASCVTLNLFKNLRSPIAIVRSAWTQPNYGFDPTQNIISFHYRIGFFS